MDPPETEAAAFHCQQAVEKYIKGVLAYYKISPPKTHDIDLLMDRVEQSTEQSTDIFEEVRDTGSQSTNYAVEIRYPYPAEPPTPGEANAALEIARDFQQRAKQLVQPNK